MLQKWEAVQGYAASQQMLRWDNNMMKSALDTTHE